MLTARRGDGGTRDEAWDWVRARWERHTDIPIYIGTHETGPFNKSAALNRAARDAGEWDMAVICDADTFCGHRQVRQAIDKARRTRKHCLAFRHVHYLTREGSQQVMGGYDGDWTPLIEDTLRGGCSSVLAVPRDVWDQVGGMDEGFAGWGEEDVAFSLAAQTMAGGLNRIAGNAWHLWHPTQPRTHHATNLARRQRYVEAHGQPEKMRALLEEYGVL